MSSLRCQACGLVNFAEAVDCTRCGKALPTTLSANRSSAPAVRKIETSSDHSPDNTPKKTSSDSKTILKVIPFVLFGVPMFLALRDRMFGPKVPVGGYTDTFELLVLAVCTIGLIGTIIVMVLTRNK